MPLRASSRRLAHIKAPPRSTITRYWRALPLGVAIPVALAMGAGAYHLLSSAVRPDEEGPRYRLALTESLWPLVDANHRVSRALTGLGRSGRSWSQRSANVERTLEGAGARLTWTSRRVHRLEVPAKGRPLANRVQDLLASERAYLAAVQGALGDRTRATALKADCAEYRLQLRLGRLNALLPGAWRNVYGAHELLEGGGGCRL